jgi:hypothetical protein
MMSTRTEALAAAFEVKVREARATVERLGDADWVKVTAAEQWSVGVTAHHYAGVLEPISQMIEGLVAGQPGTLSITKIDEMNAAHAKEHARCTKAETLAQLDRGVAMVVATIRGLSDDQLSKSGTVLSDMPR